MKKRLPGMNKLFYLFVIALLYSCTGENAPAAKNETLYLDKESKTWFPDKQSDSFVMVDNNNISQSFTSDFVTSYFLESSGSVAFVTTYHTKTEYIYRDYYATFGTRLHVSLTAKIPEFRNDVIYVSIDDYGFEYDLKRKALTRVVHPLAEYNYNESELAQSSIKLLDNYEINGKNYGEVLHFTFGARKELWKDNTVTDIYCAKGFGLIAYRLNAGIVYGRN